MSLHSVRRYNHPSLEGKVFNRIFKPFSLLGAFLIVILFIPSHAISQTDGESVNNQQSARNLLSSTFSQTRGSNPLGLHIEGNLLSGRANATPETFQADVFADGFREDVQGTNGKVHTEAGHIRLRRSKDGTTMPHKLSDEWAPRFEFLPQYHWWTEFDSPNVKLRLMKQSETIDDELCDEVRIYLPSTAFSAGNSLIFRSEKVFIGKSTHFIRMIRYETPLGNNLMHPSMIELHYTSFQSFGGQMFPTQITKSVQGLLIESVTIADISSSSATSINQH